MGLTRRRFLESSVGASAGIAASRFWKADPAVASPAGAGVAPPVDKHVVPPPTGEWMANTPASAYRAYRSKAAKAADVTTWIQIDLGETQPIESVKVYPANDTFSAGEGYPVRFKIESSNHPGFSKPSLIVDHATADFPNPQGRIDKYAASGVEGRYVRLTATRLQHVPGEAFFGLTAGYCLTLGKMDVYSGGKVISVLCPVTVDSTYGNDDDVAQITRPRGRGERTRARTIPRMSPTPAPGSLLSTRSACRAPG